MDTNELIARLVEALAWPVVTLVIILTLRKQIISLIHSVGKMKVQGVELEFKRDLDDAEKDAKRLNLPPANELKDLPQNISPQSFYEQTMSLAMTAPRAAVTEAWRAVEQATSEVVKKHNITSRGGMQAIRQLAEDGKIDEATVTLYEKLKRLRGEAAHVRDFQIESDEAIRYVDLALSLANRLQKLASVKKNEVKK